MATMTCRLHRSYKDLEAWAAAATDPRERVEYVLLACKLRMDAMRLYNDADEGHRRWIERQLARIDARVVRDERIFEGCRHVVRLARRIAGWRLWTTARPNPTSLDRTRLANELGLMTPARATCSASWRPSISPWLDVHAAVECRGWTRVPDRADLVSGRDAEVWFIDGEF